MTQTEGSVEQAIANMQAAVARKPDAVFVAIVDDKAYDAPVADARAKGIMVLAVNVDDSQGAAGNERQAFIGQSFVAAGYSLGKAQAKNFPKDGPIRVLMGVSAPGQNWSEQRAAGVLKFMDEFKKDNPGAPGHGREDRFRHRPRGRGRSRRRLSQRPSRHDRLFRHRAIGTPASPAC